jgi:hypothetical protein
MFANSDEPLWTTANGLKTRECCARKSIAIRAFVKRAVLTVSLGAAMIRSAPVGSKGASQTDSPGSLFDRSMGKKYDPFRLMGHYGGVLKLLRAR